MLGAAVIGMGYSLLQIISFGIFRILMKKDSDVCYLIEFYGDKVYIYNHPIITLFCLNHPLIILPLINFI
jgi:hypothetical protein